MAWFLSSLVVGLRAMGTGATVTDSATPFRLKMLVKSATKGAARGSATLRSASLRLAALHYASIDLRLCLADFTVLLSPPPPLSRLAALRTASPHDARLRQARALIVMSLCLQAASHFSHPPSPLIGGLRPSAAVSPAVHR